MLECVADVVVRHGPLFSARDLSTIAFSFAKAHVVRLDALDAIAAQLAEKRSDMTVRVCLRVAPCVSATVCVLFGTV
jgi:diaminopimelate decarboxylase